MSRIRGRDTLPENLRGSDPFGGVESGGVVPCCGEPERMIECNKNGLCRPY